MVDQPKWCPSLFEVFVDKERIGSKYFSKGRVLKMGRRYLPILDGYELYGSFDTRKACAEFVADQAQAWGVSMNDLVHLPKEELIALLYAYNSYIQQANEDRRYDEGWLPVSVIEFYWVEFAERG
jgi:hypothetical protein